MGLATGRQRAMFASGLVLGLAALFLLPLTIREAATTVTRKHFVRDVFIVDSYTANSEDPVLTGRLESTGETYRTTRDSIVGAERLQQLHEKGQLAGAEAEVRYLPKRGIWERVDSLVGLRVQSPNEFGAGPAPWIFVFEALVAAGSFTLVRQVVRELRT